MNKINFRVIFFVCVFSVFSSAHSNDDLLELCEPYEIAGGPHVGVYHGWFYPKGGRMRQTLIVMEESDAGNVTAKWAHGVQRNWGVKEAACHLVAGSYSGNEIKLLVHGDRKANYVFKPDGEVKAVYVDGSGNRTKGKLKKATED